MRIIIPENCAILIEYRGADARAPGFFQTYNKKIVSHVSISALENLFREINEEFPELEYLDSHISKFLINIDQVKYIDETGEEKPLIENLELMSQILSTPIFTQGRYWRNDESLFNSIMATGNADLFKLYTEKFNLTISSSLTIKLILQHAHLLKDIKEYGIDVDLQSILDSAKELEMTHREIDEHETEKKALDIFLTSHPEIAPAYEASENKAIFLMKNFHDISIPFSLLMSEKIREVFEAEPNLLFQTDSDGKTAFEVSKSYIIFPSVQGYYKHEYLNSLYSLNIEMLAQFIEIPNFPFESVHIEKWETAKQEALARTGRLEAESIIDLAIARGAFALLHELTEIGAIPSNEAMLDHIFKLAHNLAYSTGEKAAIELPGNFKTYSENLIKALKFTLLGIEHTKDENITSLVEFCFSKLNTNKDLAANILNILFLDDNNIFHFKFEDGSSIYEKLSASNNLGLIKHILVNHYKSILKITEDADILQNSIFQFCAGKNYLDFIKHLIVNEGFDPNICDKSGYPILTNLIASGEAIPNILEVAGIFAKFGAELISQNEAIEQSPICAAASHGRADILEKFKEIQPEIFQHDDIIQVIKEAIEDISAHMLAFMSPYAGEYDAVLYWLAKNFPSLAYMEFDDASGEVSGKLSYIFAEIAAQEQVASSIEEEILIEEQAPSAPLTAEYAENVASSNLLGDYSDSKEEDL